MKRFAAGAAVGLAVGALLGWVVASSGSSPSTDAPAPATAAAPRAVQPEIAGRAPPPPSMGAAREPAAPPTVKTPGAGDAVAVAQMGEQAARRIQDLEKQLAEEKTLRHMAEGEPIKAPADLPARFSGDALRRAVESALSGLKGKAGVTQVDCTEYPCIVYGEGLGTQERQDLQDTLKRSGYGGDRFWRSGGSSRREGVGAPWFAITAWPATTDDGNADGLLKRLQARQSQMQEAQR